MDDILFLGDKEFIWLEDSELKATRLLAKLVQTLLPDNPLTFNGYKLIIEDSRAINMILKDQGKRLELVDFSLSSAN